MGKACAGHCNVYDSFSSVLNIMPVRIDANFGGTLPTGSVEKDNNPFTFSVGHMTIETYLIIWRILAKQFKYNCYVQAELTETLELDMPAQDIKAWCYYWLKLETH